MINPPLPYDINSNGESLMGDGLGTRVEPAAPVAAYLEGLCVKVTGCDYVPTPEEFATVLGMAMGREGVEVPAGEPVRDGGEALRHDAREAARAWLHGYGIRTKQYIACGGDHPAMEMAYQCGTCGTSDPNLYQRCTRPGCPDGHDRVPFTDPASGAFELVPSLCVAAARAVGVMERRIPDAVGAIQELRDALAAYTSTDPPCGVGQRVSDAQLQQQLELCCYAPHSPLANTCLDLRDLRAASADERAVIADLRAKLAAAEAPDDRFAHDLAQARQKGDMDAFAGLVSGRLRQMDKRARTANARADALARDLAAMTEARDAAWEAGRDAGAVVAWPMDLFVAGVEMRGPDGVRRGYVSVEAVVELLESRATAIRALTPPAQPAKEERS